MAGASAEMLGEDAAEQRDPTEHQYPARATVDPDQMLPAERQANPPGAEGQPRPPQQRTEPHAQNEDRGPPQCRLGTAEADAGEDREKGEDRDWVGDGQREGRGVIGEQVLGIALRSGALERVGGERRDPDIEQKAGAAQPQPVLIAEQPVGNDGQAKPGNDAEHGIRARRPQPRDEPGEPAMKDRAADAQNPDRAGREGNDDADQHALQQKAQQHPGANPENGRQSQGWADTAQPETATISPSYHPGEGRDPFAGRFFARWVDA